MKTFEQFMEHHQKDAQGRVVEHGDGTPSSVEESKKKGLDGKACWDGYKLAGTKKKGGKTVDNCVKVEEQELKEYSPNVAYQAKGGKKSGKLGKSSVYSLRGKDESKKDFRKSHVKDVEGGYVGGGHKPTPGSLKKEDYYRGTGEKVVARTKKWMDKKGKKGAPGLDAMKARTAEHKAKRGVNEASVALDANIKIKNEKQRKKDQDKLAKLTHIYKGMKTGQYNSYELEGEVIDERSLSSYIPSDRKAEFDAADREYTKAMMKKKEDESTKNRGNLSKRDAGKMAKERLHDKKHGAYGEGYQRDPDRQEKERKTSKQSDPSKDNFTGISGSIATIMKQNAAMKKAAAKKKGVKEEVVAERLGGKGYKPYTSLTGKKVSGDWEDSDRGSGNKAKKRAGGTVKKKSPTYLAHVHNKEEVELDELNRYGKETGKATGSLNKRPGTAVKRGGGSDKALNFVRNMIRKETGKPAGQQKKVKGEKGRVQYGDRKVSPSTTIAKRRQAAKDADAAMRDTRGT